MSPLRFHAPFPRVLAPRLVLMGFKQRADGRLLAANLASLALVLASPPPLCPRDPISYSLSAVSRGWGFGEAVRAVRTCPPVLSTSLELARMRNQ